MIPAAIGDPGLGAQERIALELHAARCPACANEQARTQRVIALAQTHWTWADSDGPKTPSQTGDVGEYRNVPSPGQAGPMTTQASWEDLMRRCPSLAQAQQRQQRRARQRRILWRVGGPLVAAACIVMAIGIGWLTPRKLVPARSARTITIADDSAPRNASIELVTPQGRRALAFGQPVKSDSQAREILLGGIHRLVMRGRSEAVFRAVAAPARDAGADPGRVVRYEITLARGELFVEVVPGHPFTVKTGNARLDITGTKFDVRFDGDRTELVLLKGSVRFSQAAAGGERVDVTAGSRSVIAGSAAPTLPGGVDAWAATAWARQNILAAAQPEGDLLPDAARSIRSQFSPSDLDAIDYRAWRDEHRDWFAAQFPWTFKTQQVLREQHGIDADYLGLLMISGDIWQFNYPRRSDQPIPIFNLSAIEQIAAYYGIDPAQLLRAVGAGDTAAGRGAVDCAAGYRRALQCWQSDAATLGRSGNAAGEVSMFSLRAGTYLARTRTAAWAWARANPREAAALLEAWRGSAVAFPHGDQVLSHGQWLDHLKQDVTAADAVSQLAREAVSQPQGGPTTCQSQAATLGSQLADKIDSLLSPGEGN